MCVIHYNNIYSGSRVYMTQHNAHVNYWISVIILYYVGIYKYIYNMYKVYIYIIYYNRYVCILLYGNLVQYTTMFICRYIFLYKHDVCQIMCYDCSQNKRYTTIILGLRCKHTAVYLYNIIRYCGGP